MTRNGGDSAYDNMAQMFLGVRFVLVGFDPVLQAEIRSKLIIGGGVDVGKYGPSCTHVIVDNIVYDDSVCLAARNDGKTLVTGLWVEHSFDIGMAVDASLILYRPLKDLNGIPDAKSLFVCLTGYQRQDREDIMKMVVMMGAQFSKPLIANKVTHLICYKFEGEKYELAKKMKKIKLVNHRWLEDCLRAWQILPEDNYDKSTYELEMMEAEAKDSEEETGEDCDNKQFEGRDVTGCPFGFLTGTPRASKSPMPRGEVLEIHQKNVSPKVLSNVAKDIIGNSRLLTPVKDTRSDKALYFHDVNKKGLEDFGCQGNRASFEDAVSGGTSIPFDTISNLNKEYNGSTFNSRTVTRSPYSDAEKLISNSYSRKTPSRSPVYTSAEPSVHTHGSPQGGLDGKKVNMGLDLDSDCGDLNRQGRQTGTLPQQRRLAVSSYLIRSPHKGSHDPKTRASMSPSGAIREGLEFASVMIGAPLMKTGPSSSDNQHHLDAIAGANSVEIQQNGPSMTNSSSSKQKSIMSPSGAIREGMEFASVMIGAPLMKTGPSSSDNQHHLDAIAGANSVEIQQNGPSMTNSSSSKQKSLKFRLPLLETSTFDSSESPNVKVAGLPQEKISETSIGALKCSNLASEPDIGDVEICRTADIPPDKKTEPQMQHQYVKVSSPNVTTSVSEMSKSPISFGMRKSANDDGSSRSRTKKMVGQKSLGSRVRLSTESNTLKGLFSFDKTVTPNDATICPMMGAEEAEDEQKISEKHEMCRPTSAADVIMGKETEVEKTVSLDDETEVPEDQDGDVLEKPVTEKAEMVKPTSNAGKFIHKQPKQVQLSKNRRKTDAMAAEKSKGGAKHDSAVKAKKTGMDESTFIEDAVEENTANRGKHLPKKTKKAVSTVTGIKTSEKGERENEPREGKVGAEPDKAIDDKKTGMDGSMFKADALRDEMAKEGKHSWKKTKGKALSSMNETETSVKGKGKDSKELGEVQEGSELMNSFSAEMTDRENTTFEADAVKKDMAKGEQPSSKINRMAISTATIETSDEGKSREEAKNNIAVLKTEVPKGKSRACLTGKTKTLASKRKKSMDAEKENKPIRNGVPSGNLSKRGRASGAPISSDQMVGKTDLNTLQAGGSCNIVMTEPVWFILSGHHLQRKEFQQVIRHLKGRVCRDSHHWSYQATHFIVPDPVRRTEKFFAAAASGRWILKTDYLTASNQAGKFLPEEPYEWYRSGLSEDGAINLEAPRKWRLLREKTGHGAFYGMRIIIYGECIAPPLDTLKRVLKAGDGTIVATSPPYTRFLKSGVDFAIVSPGMPRVDLWVQEFLRHEIPCVLADYLVEYVCRPGYSLERHVLYNTHAWAEKSFANLQSRLEEIIEVSTPSDSTEDLTCQVCGSRDRGDVMMICGDEGGSKGCGIGMHIDCCDPPLEDVPEEDWFCSKCSVKDSTRTPKSTKRKRPSGSR
ncbi:BRCT domain-containing protein At4g02110-like [Telopea speciosissima]|uniref:BRCT domain-containing protein At4g02110-like n=1 Tax=Telopea speciosissima TaxID=54955 RepID=UPI001CC682E2|nr:BRCT domain-containing protein At4g02110-like [Telopea speciosissima]